MEGGPEGPPPKKRFVSNEPEVPEEFPIDAFSLAAAVREVVLILNDLRTLIRGAKERKEQGLADPELGELDFAKNPEVCDEDLRLLTARKRFYHQRNRILYTLFEEACQREGRTVFQFDYLLKAPIEPDDAETRASEGLVADDPPEDKDPPTVPPDSGGRPAIPRKPRSDVVPPAPPPKPSGPVIDRPLLKRRDLFTCKGPPKPSLQASRAASQVPVLGNVPDASSSPPRTSASSPSSPSVHSPDPRKKEVSLVPRSVVEDRERDRIFDDDRNPKFVRTSAKFGGLIPPEFVVKESILEEVIRLSRERDALETRLSDVSDHGKGDPRLSTGVRARVTWKFDKSDQNCYATVLKSTDDSVTVRSPDGLIWVLKHEDVYLLGPRVPPSMGNLNQPLYFNPPAPSRASSSSGSVDLLSDRETPPVLSDRQLTSFGWKVEIDPTRKQPYYWHSKSDISTWEIPEVSFRSQLTEERFRRISDLANREDTKKVVAGLTHASFTRKPKPYRDSNRREWRKVGSCSRRVWVCQDKSVPLVGKVSVNEPSYWASVAECKWSKLQRTTVLAHSAFVYLDPTEFADRKNTTALIQLRYETLPELLNRDPSESLIGNCCGWITRMFDGPLNNLVFTDVHIDNFGVSVARLKEVNRVHFVVLDGGSACKYTRRVEDWKHLRQKIFQFREEVWSHLRRRRSGAA